MEGQTTAYLHGTMRHETVGAKSKTRLNECRALSVPVALPSSIRETQSALAVIELSEVLRMPRGESL